MGYTQKFVKWFVREPVARKCFCCGKPFFEGEYREVHSSTSYHLALAEAADDGRYIYIITAPPDCYAKLKGQVVEINDGEFRLGKKYEADAVAVHFHCHKALKIFALALCREEDPDFRGGVPLPRRLHQVTHNYMHYLKEYGALLEGLDDE